MGIGADNSVARDHQPFLGQQSVLYADLAYFKIIGYIHFSRKFAYQLALLGRLDIFIGRKMVGYERDLVAVENLVAVKPCKFLYCHGACDVVAEHKVQLSLDKLAGLDRIESGMRGKNFLRHCHCHSV